MVGTVLKRYIIFFVITFDVNIILAVTLACLLRVFWIVGLCPVRNRENRNRNQNRICEAVQEIETPTLN